MKPCRIPLSQLYFISGDGEGAFHNNFFFSTNDAHKIKMGTHVLLTHIGYSF